MTGVLVLGASGMLGSMVTDVLTRDPTLRVTASVRDDRLLRLARQRVPEAQWEKFDADAQDDGLLDLVGRHPWVVNCIGVTKHVIRDDDPKDVERSVRVNALLPHRLGAGASSVGAQVLQIATDCVYSGRRGRYIEPDVHDPLDVYGKTKSLGETRQRSVHHLRCSIIGPEPKDRKFLLEWFLRQPPRARVRGFANHYWNGVTTLHFARICHGVITAGLILPDVAHIVPSGRLTKAEMLHEFSRIYGRDDVEITDVEVEETIDRTLSTTRPALNRDLWLAAGYATPPTIPHMIAELRDFDYRLSDLGE